jgi:F0F1-type ATP synthase epsilon subunit
MAKTFYLTIARVGENLFTGEVLSFAATGKGGAFQILPGHEAFVSELVPGEVRVVAADEKHYHFETPQGGLVEVSHNQATVLL